MKTKVGTGKTKAKQSSRGRSATKPKSRVVSDSPNPCDTGTPTPVKASRNNKGACKLTDEDKELLLRTLSVSPTIASGVQNFNAIAEVSISRRTAFSVIAANRERYEAIFEDNRQRHYESPLLFAGNRAQELNKMWDRIPTNALGDSDRLVLMDHYRKESEILGVEAAPSAKAKEVEAFLRSVEFGQDDLGEVPEHARSTVHN